MNSSRSSSSDEFELVENPIAAVFCESPEKLDDTEKESEKKCDCKRLADELDLANKTILEVRAENLQLQACVDQLLAEAGRRISQEKVLVNICESDLVCYPKELFEELANMFANICQRKPKVEFEVLKGITPAICVLLKHDDISVRKVACSALSRLTNGPDEHIALALPSLPTVFKILWSGNYLLVSPALRVLGNFATGNAELTQAVIDTGLLNLIPTLLFNAVDSEVVKECVWIISNIFAGTTEQIQSVIDANLLQYLFNILKEGEFRAQFEASWALVNLVHGGNPDQILEIIRFKGSLEIICRSLTVNIKELEFVNNMLEIIYRLLITVQENDPENLEFMETSMADNGCVAQIKSLQYSHAEKINAAAYKIIEEFF